MKDEIISKSQSEINKYDTFQDELITPEPKKDPKMSCEQKRIIFALTLSTFVAIAQYGSMSAFFIPFKVKYHPSITDFQVGLLLAFFEVGNLISYLLVPYVMAQLGRKNTILLSLSQSFIASIGLGLCAYIKDDFLFYITTLLLRLYQGIFDGHIFVASYAIAASEFSKNRGQAIGYLEAGMALGAMIGAPIGQTFSILMSYPFIFFGFGILLIIPITVIAFFIPSRVNYRNGDKDNIIDIKDIQDISFAKILSNRKVLKTLFFSMSGVVVMFFNQMLITNYLIEIGIQYQYTGYIMGISGLAFFIFSIISGYIVDKIENSYLVQASFITGTLSLYLQGTSKLFDPPLTSFARVLIGIVLIDLSLSLLFTSFLPNIIKDYEEEEKIAENNDQLIDKASTLYNLQFTLSCLLSPMLGGYLSDNFGYNRSCDIMGITTAFLGILYFVVNILIKHLKA